MQTLKQLRQVKDWTATQKILFRFFFLFFSLQILTENFLGFLFGGDHLFMFDLAANIFTRPCLWLNDQIFHFKYKPLSWTIYSASLHTIRDIVYLVVSIFGCLIWTLFDRKRKNYDRLHYWFSWTLIMVMSYIIYGYGIIKLIPVQMSFPSYTELIKPLGELRPFDLIWDSFGYGRPYQIFCGFFEVVSAILILFRRTRIIGLLLMASVTLNVMMINYTYQVGVLTTSFYMFLIILFLLAPYLNELFHFLVMHKTASLVKINYVPTNNLATRTSVIVGFLLLINSFVLNTHASYKIYNQRKIIAQSRQYSLVKNFMADSAGQNVSNRWKIWAERKIGENKMVTIVMDDIKMRKEYKMESDSLQHTVILEPVNSKDTTALHFDLRNATQTDWTLKGMMQGKNTEVQFHKINPDTIFKLLKIKRQIWVFDDDQDVE